MTFRSWQLCLRELDFSSTKMMQHLVWTQQSNWNLLCLGSTQVLSAWLGLSTSAPSLPVATQCKHSLISSLCSPSRVVCTRSCFGILTDAGFWTCLMFLRANPSYKNSIQTAFYHLWCHMQTQTKRKTGNACGWLTIIDTALPCIGDEAETLE